MPVSKVHTLCFIAVAVLLASTLNAGAVNAAAQSQTKREAEASPSYSSRERTVKRVFAKDSFWVKNWFRGYEVEPDLFIEPRHIVVTGGNAVVLDIGTREIRGFDTRSGDSRLKLAASRGSGPGEFRRPSGVVAVPNGFAVLDEGNGRVSAFDVRSNVLWDATIPDGVSASMCMRTDHRLIWKLSGLKNAVVETDTTGRVISRRSLPWNQDSAYSLATGVKMAGPSSRGECVMAREFGGDFAIVPVNGPPRSMNFVEYMIEPEITTTVRELARDAKTTTVAVRQQPSTHQSAMDAMIRGDTLIVRFGGNTKHAIRLLDYYLLPSGKYLHSRKLPGYVISLALAPDGSFIFGEILPEYAGIGSIRPSLTKPAKKPETNGKNRK